MGEMGFNVQDVNDESSCARCCTSWEEVKGREEMMGSCIRWVCGNGVMLGWATATGSGSGLNRKQ